MPLGPYIVDFCCLEAFLVIEVDGGQHNGSLRDEVRDAWLKSEGFSVLRFWNNEVLENLEGVLWRIASFSGAGGEITPTQPSPLKGEG